MNAAAHTLQNPKEADRNDIQVPEKKKKQAIHSGQFLGDSFIVSRLP
jgi:hypothetical protein